MIKQGLQKRSLEIWLQKIPSHPDPKPELEQYSTPGTVASDILFTAYSLGDIHGRVVIDLGCGTGTFTLGAAWCGAQIAYGVDVDEGSIAMARNHSEKENLSERCRFFVGDVESFNKKGNTVVMNPPFGSQKKGADRPFLKKAFDLAPRIYSLHNARSEDFLRRYIIDNGFHVFGEKRYMFPVDRLFDFHTENRKVFETVLFMIERN